MESWRGFVNGVLYGVQFQEKLDDELATREAQQLVNDPIMNLAPEEEYAALVEAVEVGTDLTALIPEPHSEQAFREFLTKVLREMDDMRPWPDLPFRGLDVSEWANFEGAQPVARIALDWARAQERIRNIFRKPAGEEREVCVLRLKSGTDVALVSPWWPDSKNVAVMVRGQQRPPEETVAELVDATLLEPDEVTLLAGAGARSPVRSGVSRIVRFVRRRGR